MGAEGLEPATNTSLTVLHGIGRIKAATILAETGNVARFPSRNRYASYAGTAPLDDSSGDIERYRVKPAGNRKLNWAIHITAVIQIRNRTHRDMTITNGNWLPAKPNRRLPTKRLTERSRTARDQQPTASGDRRPEWPHGACGQLKGAMGADSVRLDVGAYRTVRPIRESRSSP